MIGHLIDLFPLACYDITVACYDIDQEIRMIEENGRTWWPDTMTNKWVGQCLHCKGEIAHPMNVPGRKPKYCTEACKQAAYRQRRFLAENKKRQELAQEYFSE